MTEEIRPITILIVDDEKMISELLGDTLEALGYKTITADCYEAAVERLKNDSIDVAVADIILPDKSGVDLIKYIKENYPQVPVLAISGKGLPADSVYQAGADAFLAKPFRIGVVEEMIKKALDKHDIKKTVPSTRKKRILVVDDEPAVISTLIEALRALGYDAEGAADGQEGMEKLTSGDFDLVITDIRMPLKNGIDLMREIKATYPDIFVVIITGYPLAYPPEKAAAEGADGYIAKPFRINQIDKLLSKLLYNFQSNLS